MKKNFFMLTGHTHRLGRKWRRQTHSSIFGLNTAIKLKINPTIVTPIPKNMPIIPPMKPSTLPSTIVSIKKHKIIVKKHKIIVKKPAPTEATRYNNSCPNLFTVQVYTHRLRRKRRTHSLFYIRPKSLFTHIMEVFKVGILILPYWTQSHQPLRLGQ